MLKRMLHLCSGTVAGVDVAVVAVVAVAVAAAAAAMQTFALQTEQQDSGDFGLKCFEPVRQLAVDCFLAVRAHTASHYQVPLPATDLLQV